MNKVYEFVNEPSNMIDHSYQLSDFNEMFKALNSKQEAINQLSKFTSNPTRLYQLIEEQHYSVLEFRTKHPEILELEEVERYELIEQAFIQIKNSKYKVSEKGSTEDWCDVVYNEAIDACHIVAGAASISCGLMAPSIFPALLCAGVVIVNNELCHHNAEVSLKACKAAQVL